MKKVLLFLLASVQLGGYGQAQDLRWVFQTDGKIYASPDLAEGMVYIGSEDGRVYAVDAATGVERWRFQTEGAVHSSPVVEDGHLFVGSQDGVLYALDAETGAQVWAFQTGGEKVYDTWDYYLSSPCISEDRVLFGSGDGHVYALDKQTGALQWKFETGDVVHADVVVSDRIAYVGSYDGTLYALRVEDGSAVWMFKTVGDTYFPKGEIQKAALVHEGVVYFGSRDYNIYALDAKTGTGRWNMKEQGSWVIATPTFYQDHIFFGTSDSHRVYSMQALTGAVQWTLPLNMRVYGSMVVANNLLYFGCFNGKLYGVDPETGAVQWTFQTEGSKQHYGAVYNEEDHFKEGFALYGANWQETEETILSLGSILSTPVVADQVIYFGSADGRLYAVNLP